MKPVSFYTTMLFFLLLSCSSETVSEKYEVIHMPVILSGNYGDTIERVIKAGPDGAKFRFLHPEFKDALWNYDKLIHKIIDKYKLHQKSTDFEIVYAVADYIKRRGIEAHIQGYPGLNEITDSQGDNIGIWASYPMSTISVTSKMCGFFNAKLEILVQAVTRQLGVEPIKVRGIGLPKHQTNTYWDNSLQKWVYIDVDPGSKVFIPKKHGNLVSLDDLLKDPEIILDTTSLFLYEDIDSLSIYWVYREMLPNLADSSQVQYYDFEETIETNKNIFYKLLPNQQITWEYSITGVYEDRNKQLEISLYKNNLRKLFENSNEMDSVVLIDSAISIIQSISKVLELDWKHYALNFFSERIQKSDSSYYGKDAIREEVFTVEYPIGKYSSDDIYIPHLVKSIEGNVSLNEINFYNFEWKMYSENNTSYESSVLFDFGKKSYDISEPTKVIFYGNDRIQLVPKIALFEGSLMITNSKNGEIINCLEY